MIREISAGGVVIRRLDGAWWMAVIEPPTQPEDPAPGLSKKKARKLKTVLALPKGLVDPGEKPLETALREVREETGLTAELIAKLGDIKYVYVRSWGDREKVFKIVSFYLMRYVSGHIDDIAEAMRVEVARAKWVRLDEAAKLLAYAGEKQMAKKAAQHVTGQDGL